MTITMANDGGMMKAKVILMLVDSCTTKQKADRLLKP